MMLGRHESVVITREVVAFTNRAFKASSWHDLTLPQGDQMLAEG